MKNYAKCSSNTIQQRCEREMPRVVPLDGRLTVHQLHQPVVDVHVHKQRQAAPRSDPKWLQLRHNGQEVLLTAHRLLRQQVREPLQRPQPRPLDVERHPDPLRLQLLRRHNLNTSSNLSEHVQHVTRGPRQTGHEVVERQLPRELGKGGRVEDGQHRHVEAHVVGQRVAAEALPVPVVEPHDRLLAIALLPKAERCISGLRTKMRYTRRNSTRSAKQSSSLSREMDVPLHRMIPPVVGDSNAVDIKSQIFGYNILGD